MRLIVHAVLAALLAATRPAASATTAPPRPGPLRELGAITCEGAFLLLVDRQEASALCYRVAAPSDGAEWKDVRYRIESWAWNEEAALYELAGVRSGNDLAPSADSRIFPCGPQAPGLAAQGIDPELPPQTWQGLVLKDLVVVAVRALPGKEPRRLAAAVASRRSVDPRRSLGGILVVELPAKGPARAAFQWLSEPGRTVTGLDLEDLTADGTPELLLHTTSGGRDEFHLFEITGR